MRLPEFDATISLSQSPTLLDIEACSSANGVFLIRDREQRPLMLGVAANLQKSISGKLLEQDDSETDKRRAKLAGVAGSVSWKATANEFERYLVYWRLARGLYPKTYKSMLPFSASWFVTIDDCATFPRFQPTQSPPTDNHNVFGPLIRRRDAEALIRMLEDAFDLCRYYDVLLRTPNGERCAYYDMGRCPAPCDGTVPFSHYRKSIANALAFLRGEDDTLKQPRMRMSEAAAATKFELANVYKKVISELDSFLKKPAYEHAKLLIDDCQIAIFLADHRKRNLNTAALRAIAFHNGSAIELSSGPYSNLDALHENWIAAACNKTLFANPLPSAHAELISLLARYKFKPDQRTVAIVALDSLTDRGLVSSLIEKHLLAKDSADTGVED